jgi:peptidoglycan/xylan/chitin deacetylase (PgdA/CDA1 family)
LGGIDRFSYKHERPEMEIMDWEDIDRARTYGIEFGSHTATHSGLTVLNDDQLDEELTRSRDIIAEKLKPNTMALAYPFGLYDDRVKQQTIAAGYDCALGFGNVMSNTYATDLYELKREKVLSRTGIEEFKRITDVRHDFYRKVAGAFGK